MLIVAGPRSWFACRIGLGEGWWGVYQSWGTGKRLRASGSRGETPLSLDEREKRRRRLPAHLQATQPQDPPRVPPRHPPADAPGHLRHRLAPPRVNWLEIVSAKPGGAVTHRGAFVTSLDVDRDNVAELADCARARWKIENETFNVLKQHGYHLEHNFGHGKDNLAAVLVVPDLLAFALHAAADLAETLWQTARRRLGTRYRLFEHLRTLAEYPVFPDWNALPSLLATGGTANPPP